MKLEIDTAVEARMTRVQLAEIVRFVCPPRVSGFTICFRPQLDSNESVQGRKFYWSARAYITDNRIVIRVPVCRPDRYSTPYKHGDHGAYIPIREFTFEESMVQIVAHELRHLWQGIVKRGHRVWGSRGLYSERDASAYGLRMLRAWRRRPARQK